ncbi:MAG: hypothetical protein M3P49_15800, partial [Actinomycetota bacterium]|nr:hypothetical protein [Actinomycetota bacterium]
ARRHETRPAALRAIVMYPMNALVNDQLRRLRRTLDSSEGIAWQRRHLNGNLIRFGRYTGQTELPGLPDDERRRRRWKEYSNRIRTGWESVGDELRDSGGWPRPDGAEMLCRWDMQAAPPDVLVTNYSMLEYMLVRPMENAIFEQTRRWLAASEEHVLTLVLDEAHSYTGAQGTEVAYLIRRLFERLDAGPEQVRCVATSATLGATEEDLHRVRKFASELFGHDEERFTVVRAEVEDSPEDAPAPNVAELRAFAGFQRRLERDGDDRADEGAVAEASVRLLGELGGGLADGEKPAEALHEALREHPRLLDLRLLTARRAQEFGEVSDAVWGDLGDEGERQQATAGLLSAGAYARRGANPDVPPLLPSRLHLMFRGLTGMWACMDPGCPEAVGEGRPCGKLYAEPRIWCDCAARVLEMFHCRMCGLLFLGGIPDGEGHEGRLWPYEGDLEGGFQDYARYQMFAIEDPGGRAAGREEWAEERRSVLTTAVVGRTDAPGTRTVWVNRNRKAYGRRPSSCPRCSSTKSAANDVVRPMRSTGPQPLRVLVEHAFRCQPARTTRENGPPEPAQPAEPARARRWFRPKSEREGLVAPVLANPNGGRKAIVFSDGRQEAATLAGNLTHLHHRDLFRQFLLVALREHEESAQRPDLPVPKLRERMMGSAIKRGIDPTFGEVEGFWSMLAASSYEAQKRAAPILDSYLRREVADREFGVEALGFARWVLDFEGEDVASSIPPLRPFDGRETLALLHAVLRILAAENVILPSNGEPQAWPEGLVEFYYRKTVVRPP